MSNLDKKIQGKVNTIISEIKGFMSEFLPQYETDIAIEVMKDFGKAGEHQAMAIKVNYGCSH